MSERTRPATNPPFPPPPTRTWRRPELSPGTSLPCDYCKRPTPERERLFDGRVRPICDSCWMTKFAGAQRERIQQQAARIELRIVRCGVCDWPIDQLEFRPGVFTALCQRCRVKSSQRPTGAARTGKKRKPSRSRGSAGHGFGIYPVTAVYHGGAPGLGKRA